MKSIISIENLQFSWPKGPPVLQISEFLLVPYFGACIHLPPPANQIIEVIAKNPSGIMRGSLSAWK
jgi:hypothetical protein